MPLDLTLHATRRPRFVDRGSREPSWRTLHRLADAAYPAFALAWQVLFEDLQESLDFATVQTALETRNLLVLDDVVRSAWTRLATEAQQQALLPILTDLVGKAGAAMAPSTSATLGVSVAFNVAAPEVLAVAEQYAGTQILGIGETTLQAVRQSLRLSFAEGRGLAQLRADLRSVIGVTPRQAATLERLRQRLTTDGMSVAGVRARVAEASARAIRQRVEAIARMETIWAANAGQNELWLQAEKDGVLDPRRLERSFIVTPDDRTCPVCRPMQGQRRGLREPFVSPYNGATALFPPMHVMCRCAVKLITVL